MAGVFLLHATKDIGDVSLNSLYSEEDAPVSAREHAYGLPAGLITRSGNVPTQRNMQMAHPKGAADV